MGTSVQVITLANSIIGVSILAMPFCFKQCGIILSVLLLLFSSVLTRLCCHFLVKSAHLARRRNYEFLAFHTFGPTGKLVVELSIIGFLLGTSIAFFVVIGDLGPDILVKAFNIEHTPTLRPSVLVVLAVCVVLPLGLLRNVDSLGFVCMASILFYLCLVLKVLSEAMPHLLAADWLDHVNLWRPAGVLQCLPIFSMALACQTQVFEIYESLPDASPTRMNEIVRSAVHMCTGVYICVGFFGYVAFCTQNFTGNVMLSFSPSMATDIMKLGFVLSIAVSFPLVIFPCRASLYSLLFRRASSWHPELASGPSHIPETRFKCLTLFLVTVSLLVGLLLPNIELVLGLVGSTIGTIICLLLPALMFTRLAQKYSSERLVAQVIFFIAGAILILSTYANLYAADKATTGEMSSVVSFRPPELKKAMPVMDLSNINQPQIVMGKGVIGNLKDPPRSGADIIKEDLERKLKRKKPELVIKDEAIRIEPPIPQEPKEPKKQIEPQAPVVKEKVQSEGTNEVVKQNQLPKVVEAPKIANEDNNLPKADAVKVSASKSVQGESPPPVKAQSPAILPMKPQEQVAQDAILKDEKEQAADEEGVKKVDLAAEAKLLEKLAEHEEKQKSLLEEQQKIRKELEEHKKESMEDQAKKESEIKEQQLIQEAEQKKLPVVEAQNTVEDKMPVNPVPAEKVDASKKEEEQQNIGEIVNGLQKLTKELKESLDEIKKQKNDDIKKKEDVISKADIKPVAALLKAKKSEHSKNAENDALPKRIKRETEGPDDPLKITAAGVQIKDESLMQQPIQPEALANDSANLNYSSVNIKVPQQLTMGEIKLESDKLTSNSETLFEAKPITRDLKTFEEEKTGE